MLMCWFNFLSVGFCWCIFWVAVEFFGLFMCYVTTVFNHAKSSVRFHNPTYSTAPYLHSDLISGLGKCVLSSASAEPVGGGVWFHLIKLFCILQLGGWNAGGIWDVLHQYWRLYACGQDYLWTETRPISRRTTPSVQASQCRMQPLQP